MPKPSLSNTCTSGARQFVVQLALEMMLCLAGIIFVVVHAHDDRDVFALGGRGNDHLLRAGSDMALGLFGFGEQAGGFDHDIDAQLLPRQFGGRLGADDLDLLAVHDQHIVFGFVGRGFLAS